MLGCTLDEAASRITSDEFARWLAYWRLYPPAADRNESQMATLMGMFATACGVKHVKCADYMVSARDSSGRGKISVKEFVGLLKALANK